MSMMYGDVTIFTEVLSASSRSPPERERERGQRERREEREREQEREREHERECRERKERECRERRLLLYVTPGSAGMVMFYLTE